MSWVQYDPSGAICGICANQQNGAYSEKFLPDDDPSVVAFLHPPKPQMVLSQDLMAQFTADDAAKIQAAIAGNVQFWLLWQSLTTQKDPMIVSNQRFLSGWNALVQVLGPPRMDGFATALGVTI